MSIKTIDIESVGTDTGMAKKINKGAHKLVFDILQATQYSTPIPSTVRELVTNACDSQREKEIAIEILSGQKQVSDYYIERHGDQYEDSNFDSSYYDLKHLSTNNKVILTYKHVEGVGYCDRFSVKDYGVGIGGKRLEGVLELGYSTKRNTSQNFGAFGLGAKVALSTGVEYYTIETVYNGKRFKVNCYSYKTEFAIPKFNLVTGQMNPSIELSDGSTIYYEETNDVNWTEVSLGVKKHNSSRFREAISEQLNYIDNVEYNVIDEGTELPYPINFKTPVIYNSNRLIISSGYGLTKPHIVIVKDLESSNGINYGYIDFKELEMQQLYGAIGLKCPIRQVYTDDNGEQVIIQDGVDVTPSREKVIWNDSTKAYIQKLIEEAAQEATDLVESELNEDDFIKWITTCRDVLQKKTDSGTTNATVLYTLSNIVDTSELKPKFTKNKKIRFASPAFLMPGFQVKTQTVSIVTTKTNNGANRSISVSGEDAANWNSISLDSVYVATGPISRLKNYYLTDLHGGKFTLIYPKSLEAAQTKIDEADTNEDRLSLISQYDALVANQDLILPLLQESVYFKNYDDIVVPDDVSLSLAKKEDELQTEVMYSEETPEERRVRLNKIVAFSLRRDKMRDMYVDQYTWDKVEPILNDVMTSESEVYYGTTEDEAKIRLAASIIEKYAPLRRNAFNQVYGDSASYKAFYTDSPPVYTGVNVSYKNTTNCPQLLRVSAQNVKHLEKNPNCKHIDEFFYTIDAEDRITVNPAIKILVTFKYFTDKLPEDKNVIINKLENLNKLGKAEDIFNTIYKIFTQVISEFNLDFAHVLNKEELNIQRSFWDKLVAFQEASTTCNSEELAELSENLFIFTDIPGVDILDYELLDILKYSYEILDTMHPILAPMYISDYDSNTCKAINEYFNYKLLNLVQLPLGCSSFNELNQKLKNPKYDYSKCNRG